VTLSCRLLIPGINRSSEQGAEQGNVSWWDESKGQGEGTIYTHLTFYGKPGTKCKAVITTRGSRTLKSQSIHTHTILFSLGGQPVVHCFNNTVPEKKKSRQCFRKIKQGKQVIQQDSKSSCILSQAYLRLNLQMLLAVQTLKH